jgi:hypothetical protein
MDDLKQWKTRFKPNNNNNNNNNNNKVVHQLIYEKK